MQMHWRDADIRAKDSFRTLFSTPAGRQETLGNGNREFDYETQEYKGVKYAMLY